jgi:hypothetical protein
VRLEPSFLLSHGLSIYPAPSEAVTTWIYGPLPVFLLWPATLAADAAGALVTAGVINLIFTAGMIAVVCALWPAALSWRERLLAATACVAFWPAASFLYIQADNYAVACGLLANLILIRAQGPPGALRGWLAALAAAGAIMCKQTSVGLVLAPCLWLGWRFGFRIAVVHLVRVGAMTAGLLTATLGWFGVENTWFNLVHVPGHLPWTSEIGRRFADLAPLLLVHLGIPAGILIFAGRRIWRAESPLLLPALTWCCVLPAGVAGILTLGGTLNSLQGLLYLMPPVLLAGVEKISRSTHGRQWTGIGLAVVVLAVIGTREALSPPHALKPMTASVQQAANLASGLKGQIWFPWNPLITIYSEGRFYEVEDGLYVRFLAGHPLTYAQARAHLPDHWRVTAMPAKGSDWGIALRLQPDDAKRIDSDRWTLHFWETPPAVVTPR